MVKNMLTANQCRAEGGTSVPVSTVDRVLEKSSFGDVDVMKIDVEGYEPWALEGAQRMFAQKPPKAVISEWIGFRIKESNWPHDPLDFFDTFFPPSTWSYSQAGQPTKGYEAVKAMAACWAQETCPFHAGGDFIFRYT